METVKSEKEFGAMKIEVMYVFGTEVNEELGTVSGHKTSVFVKITNNGKVVTEFAELNTAGEMPAGSAATLGHSGKLAVSQATLDKILEVLEICKKEANDEKQITEQKEKDAAILQTQEINKAESKAYDDHAARVDAMMTLNNRSY